MSGFQKVIVIVLALFATLTQACLGGLGGPIGGGGCCSGPVGGCGGQAPCASPGGYGYSAPAAPLPPPPPPPPQPMPVPVGPGGGYIQPQDGYIYSRGRRSLFRRRP